MFFFNRRLGLVVDMWKKVKTWSCLMKKNLWLIIYDYICKAI